MIFRPHSALVATTLLLWGNGCAQEPTASADKAQRKSGATSMATTGPKTTPRPRRPPPRRVAFQPHAACRFLTEVPRQQEPAVKIADASENLDRFFETLLELLSKSQKRKKVRIAFYGDSNATMDWAASHLRRFLGKRFGHGGHGFVAAGRSVPWYQHREIRTWSSGGFKAYCITHPRNHKRPFYGHAGHISIGKRMGSFAHWNSAESGSPADEVFSTVQLHYLCWPQGGRFKVLVDKTPVREVQTRCDKRTAKHLTLRVKDGRHVVRLQVEKTIVGVFGAAFENDRRGVVVDGLGVGALNVKTMQEIKSQLFAAGLRARRYDLVILHTGTNMWGPGFHPGWAKEVITRIRTTLGPNTSILVLSPPAFGKWIKGRIQGHKRMAACAREKRDISAANKIAFWDYFRSMGGRNSVARWRKADHLKGDLVHFKPSFHKLMMKRLGRALMARFRAFLRRKKIRCRPKARSTRT